ncbi:MAG: carboxypeptidase-like regulatory domain-containing protein, partial [Planctomycetota bacterium]
MRTTRLVMIALVATLGVVTALLILDGPTADDPVRLESAAAESPLLPSGDAPVAAPAVPLAAELFIAERSEALRSALPRGAAQLPPELLTGSIRVRVEDSLGNPVSDARLLLDLDLSGLSFSSWSIRDFQQETRSDETGQARFSVPPAGLYHLRVEREGFAPAHEEPVSPGDLVTIRLSEGCVVSGRVTCRETGLPLTAAAVRVRQERREEWSTTDAEGEFLVSDIGDGRCGLELFAEGYDLERLAGVEACAEDAEPLAIELAPGATLTGEVLDRATQEPVAGAEVELLPRGLPESALIHGKTTRSDALGRFVLERISRSGMQLVVRGPGYAEANQTIRIDPDEEEGQVKVSLLRATSIAGVARTSDGSPAAGVAVIVGGAPRESRGDRQVLADEQGRFSLGGLWPGQAYELFAAGGRERLAPSEKQTIVTSETGSPVEVEVLLEPGAALAGLVVDAAGEPVPFAQVTANGLSGRVWQLLERTPALFADSEGRFRFQGLPAETIQLAARRGEEVSGPEEVTLLAGEEVQVTLPLAQGLLLSGVVVDPDGLPVEDATVSVFAARPSFSLPRLPDTVKEKQRAPRPEKVASGKPRKTARREEKAKDRGEEIKRKQKLEEREDKLVELDQKGSLLRSATGGKSGAALALRGHARTDRAGGFRVSGLFEAEKLVLVIRKEGFDPRRVYEVLPDEKAATFGEQRRIVLSPLLSLTGRALDSRTRTPLVRFTVAARPVGDPPSQVDDLGAILTRRHERSHGFKSGDGSFELERLQPGAYEVTVRARGYRASGPHRVHLPVLPGFEDLHLLTPGSVVAGRVLSGDGAPVASVPVFLVAAGPADEGKKSDQSRKERRQGALQRTTGGSG